MGHDDVYPFEKLFLQRRTLSLKLAPKETLKIMYDLAAAIHRIMERHGVVYFLDMGSALGAFRHQGITPWDDDLDIIVHEKSEPHLQGSVKEDLYIVYGIDVVRLIGHPVGYKIFAAPPYEHLFCDVWIISQKDSQSQYYRRNKLGFKHWPEGFNPSSIHPVLTQFGDFEMRILAKDAYPYFDKMYGDLWECIAMTTGWEHSKDIGLTPMAFVIPPRFLVNSSLCDSPLLKQLQTKESGILHKQ